MKFRTCQLTIISVLMMWLSGCALLSNDVTTHPPKIVQKKQRDSAWQDQQQQLMALQKWTMQGTIGVRWKEKAQSASFIWHQNGQSFYLELYGAFGIGDTVFKGTPTNVTMIDHHGNKHQADSLQALMDQQVGWHLPIEGLIYWGRGLAIPDVAKSITLNQYGLLATLRQKGWQIQYQDYQVYADQWALPTRITLQRNDLTLTAVIKQWDV